MYTIIFGLTLGKKALFMTLILHFDSAFLTLSVVCQNFNVEANDTMTNGGAPGYMGQHRVPIASSKCSFSLVFDSFRNRSWVVSCSMDSLAVTDLISSRIDGGCKEQTLIGNKLLFY